MKLTPELLLSAYAQGYFPMARSRRAKTIEWYYPEERGVIPLEDFHTPKSLLKVARKSPYTITMNRDFRAVITHCADAPREDGGTWINDEIIEAYCELHTLGFAQSVEVWSIAGSKQADEPSAREAAPHVSASRRATGATLIGGLYGVCLKRAFFGESMFSLMPNASKLALVHLVEWLRANDYTLLDTQYVNDHLQQFGVRAVSRADYLQQLQNALK